VAVNNYFLN